MYSTEPNESKEQWVKWNEILPMVQSIVRSCETRVTSAKSVQNAYRTKLDDSEKALDLCRQQLETSKANNKRLRAQNEKLLHFQKENVVTKHENMRLKRELMHDLGKSDIGGIQPDEMSLNSQLVLVDKPVLDGTIPLPGEIVIHVTGDLSKDLKLLQSRFGIAYESLLKQEFKPRSGDNTHNSVTVLQFNMLSDALSDAYLLADTEKSFTGVDKQCLRWTYRGLRLMEVLATHNTDIITMEECDRFEFFKPYLEGLGYECYYKPKDKSPTKHVARQIREERPAVGKDFKCANDGLLIAFKTNKFQLCGDVQMISKNIDDPNHEKPSIDVVALAVPLRTTNPDSKSESLDFLVVCTHLKSTKAEKGENIRRAQIEALMGTFVENGRNLPIILGCDLNANPIVNKNGYEPQCYKTITNDKQLGFKSAYQLGRADGKEPPFTTFKLRKGGEDKHTIDYIFLRGGKGQNTINGNWQVTGLLTIPTDDKNLIPSWKYPSDHFAIGARLQWSQEHKANTDAEEAKTEEVSIEKGLGQILDLKNGKWPLPGEINFEQTGTFKEDLDRVKRMYDGKYKPLLEQKWQPPTTDMAGFGFSGDKSFSFVQFNMLADALTGGYVMKDTPKTFIGVEKECLRWTYRGVRLVELIHTLNPDIATIEECDQFPFFEKYLGQFGYKCCYVAKNKSPTRHTTRELGEERNDLPHGYKCNNDGLLIAFKKEKFDLISGVQIQSISDADNPENVTALAVPLKSKKITKGWGNECLEFIVVCTHLKSTKTAEGEKIRRTQIEALFDKYLKNDHNLPIVFGCDLNATPQKVVKEDPTEGYESLCYPFLTSDKMGFESMYRKGSGDKDSEPPFTTFKLRKHGVDKHTIDYIFVKGGNWKVKQLLSIPSGDERIRIPSWSYPSDHFAIGAVLEYQGDQPSGFGW